MTERKSSASRRTKETEISASLNLDGTGTSELDIPIPFLKHMLNLFAKHSGFDLSASAAGDIEVDDHHLTEDLGIVLGTILKEALDQKKGINRYGHMILPMDEVLVMTAVDLGGRPYLGYEVEFKDSQSGEFDPSLSREFWQAFVNHSFINLHIKILTSGNAHHVLEGVFKSTARSLKEAVKQCSDGKDSVPSTKGML